MTVGPSSPALDDWGREPGRRPPLPSWAPLVWWMALAVTLGTVVVLLVRPPGPLDQPDPARQRDGLLLDGPVVPATVGDISFGGRPVVVLFDREPPDQQRLEAWLSDMPDAPEVYLVLPQAVPESEEGPIDLVVDTEGRIADAVSLPTPVDGGTGIGYAVVDSARRVRYSTLDPAYLVNGFEVATVLRWVT